LVVRTFFMKAKKNLTAPSNGRTTATTHQKKLKPEGTHRQFATMKYIISVQRIKQLTETVRRPKVFSVDPILRLKLEEGDETALKPDDIGEESRPCPAIGDELLKADSLIRASVDISWR